VDTDEVKLPVEQANEFTLVKFVELAQYLPNKSGKVQRKHFSKLNFLTFPANIAGLVVQESAFEIEHRVLPTSAGNRN
jgi:hypothetical protein